MGIKKFIENVKEVLGLEDPQKATKKKSIKNLLKKLNKRKEEAEKLLNSKLNKKDKKELVEEIDIIVCQIRKGEKILAKLILKTI